MGTPHEKQRLDHRDWVTVSLLWFALFLCTWLLWRIWKFVDAKYKPKLKKPKTGIQVKTRRVLNMTQVQSDTVLSGQSGRGSRHRVAVVKVPRVVRADAKKHPNKVLKALANLDPLNTVLFTAFFVWLRVALDTVSWTYIVTAKMWDWFVVVFDACSIGVGTMSCTLLLVVFIKRCYGTFQNTKVQHSANVYNVLCALTTLVALFSIAMFTTVLFLQWKLLTLFAIGFVSFASISSALLICMFFKPMFALSVQLEDRMLLHVAVRISVLSAIALISTCATYLCACIAYQICDECNFTYVYYNATTVDSVINLLCLTWSLRVGQNEYHRFCDCLHSAFFGCLDAQVDADGNYCLLTPEITSKTT